MNNLSAFILFFVIIGSFFQMVVEEPVIHPAISVFFFIVALWWIGFQPRKPYTIHAYMNGVFMKMFLLLGVGMTGGNVLWLFASFMIFSLPLWATMTGVFIFLGLIILAMVYVLYWSLPFSRKEKGIPAVDAAIARYKKPNEEVAGAWEPDLIVDGKAYSLITYLGGKGGQLAFDMQGNVARDLELMRKISCCSQLAIQSARPDAINQRTNGYTSTQKGMKQLEIGLRKYDQWVLPLKKLGEETGKHIENIKSILLLFQSYGPAVCEGWKLEAEWGNQRGNAQLKEVRYEDMLVLSNRINENLSFLLMEAHTLSSGIESALEIQNLMKKNREIDRQSPNLKYLLELALVFREVSEIVKNAVGKGEKELPSKYGNGFKEEQIKLWESRLKWVDKVDGGKA